MKRTGGEWPEGTEGAHPDVTALQLLAEEAKGEELQEHPLPILASSTLSPCQAYPHGLSGWPWGRVNTHLGVLVHWLQPPARPCHPSSPSSTASCLSSLLTCLHPHPGILSCLGKDGPSPHRVPQDIPASPIVSPGLRCPVLVSDLQPHTLLSSSSPMAFALSTYMNHTGIRSREPRVAGTSEKAQSLPDRDKWLPFFPKTKKVGGLLAAAPLPQGQALAARSFEGTCGGVLQRSLTPPMPCKAA